MSDEKKFSGQKKDFRERLLGAERMSPELREAYRKELDALLNETHTARSRWPGAILMVVSLAVVAAEIRAMIVHRGGGVTFYIAAITMLAACAVAAVWIGRDLIRGRSARRQSFKMADLFYGAASILTVAQLLHGMTKPADPASTFGVLFVFVFLTVCANWSFSNRITAAELTVKEQGLRIEARLVELAERVGG